VTQLVKADKGDGRSAFQKRLRLISQSGVSRSRNSQKSKNLLHSSYTAKNMDIIHNKNNVIRNLYHPLRMTPLRVLGFLARLKPALILCAPIAVVLELLSIPGLRIECLDERSSSYPTFASQRWGTHICGGGRG